MFARLDTWLIEKAFEPVAHRIEHGLGFSNYMLAMALLVVWPATVGATAIADQSALGWTLAAMSLGVGSVRYLWLAAVERRRQSARSMTVNEERICCFAWRMLENGMVAIGILLFAIGLILGRQR